MSKLTEIKLTDMELFEVAYAICSQISISTYHSQKRCNATNRVVKKIIKASEKAGSVKQVHCSGLINHKDYYKES